MNRRFHLVSLGCPKNLVDSEVLYGILERAGWQGSEDPSAATVLMVNTCGFIRPAVEESLEEIFELATWKQQDPAKYLVVIGCLVQRYGRELSAALPEVDLFVGTEGAEALPGLLEELSTGRTPSRLLLPEPTVPRGVQPRRLSEPFFSAGLKITEGCDNHCAYCLIPSIRGSLRSRSLEDLVSEAQILEDQGVRELILVAQDITAYGRDRGRDELPVLLERLLAATSIPWLRLMYLYPTGICERLLRLLSAEDRLLPYLDIPLQHVSDRMLGAMNRRYGRRDIESLLCSIRQTLPGVALRTTFLTGFPGETEEDVQELVSFIESARFDHVGVFGYANEEGSPAEHFPGQVDENEKEVRVERLMTAQAAVSSALLQRRVGRVESVLVEGCSQETDLLLAGRTVYQAPEVDGCVLINEGDASPGEILKVEITGAQIYDLVGRIV